MYGYLIIPTSPTPKCTPTDECELLEGTTNNYCGNTPYSGGHINIIANTGKI